MNRVSTGEITTSNNANDTIVNCLRHRLYDLSQRLLVETRFIASPDLKMATIQAHCDVVA